MTRRFSVIAVLSLALCFLPGCFTYMTQLTGDPPGPRVFSGTRAHLRSMAHPNDKSGGNYWLPGGGILLPLPLPLVFWAPLDLPLSFAADIAILPYTIPAQLICGNFKEQETEGQEAPSTRSTEK